jgi:WD40 repeat protein
MPPPSHDDHSAPGSQPGAEGTDPGGPPAADSDATQSQPPAPPSASGGVPPTAGDFRGPDGDGAAAPGGAFPRPLGGYELLRELGRGGMGVVYQARQAGLGRLVALKMLLHAGHADEAQRERIRSEAQAVARLRHPHIVQVYEVGEHGGLPYFSLEFCEGGSLADRLAGGPLPPAEAARLVGAVAGAVQAAHGAGVVHRDLKPSNVLLLADGTPKVADFSLAKRLDQAGQTQTGAVLGTPSYMAPEQAGGKVKEVGPAADVYALGAVLYECLTGRPPFRGPTPVETVLQVLSDEPVPVRRLQPGVPRDLETVCHKCLQKEPHRRYPTARALADDLRAFGEGRPVAARPVGRAERAWRWCRRNPAVAGLLAAVAAALVLGAVISWAFAVRAAASARLAREEKRQADLAREQADAKEREARESERQARGEKARAEWLLYASQMARAHREWETGNRSAAWQSLRATRPELRGWEYRYVAALLSRDERIFYGHTREVRAVAWGPDGQRLATASEDGTARVWDARTGRELLALPGHAQGVSGVAYSPDGKRLATASEDGTARLWDAAAGAPGAVLRGHAGGVSAVAFRPDGTILATASRDRTARLWDAATGQPVLTIGGHADELSAVAFSPEGKRLATASRDGTARVWDAQTGREVLALRGHAQGVTGVAFSPDGRRLLTASGDRTARVWDAATGAQRLALHAHTGPVTAAAFSPDGKRLATACRDKWARLWDAATGGQPSGFGDGNPLLGVAFSPDGRWLATASAGRTARVWDVGPRPGVMTLEGHAGRVSSAALTPDGKRLATGAQDGVRVWDTDTGRALLTLRQQHSPVRKFADSVTSALFGAGRGADYVLAVALSPDGRRVAAAFLDGTAFIWDAASGQELVTLQGHTAPLEALAWSPDGGRLAAVSRDGTVGFWDAASGRKLLPLKRVDGIAVNVLAFSADGRRLVVAVGQTARLYDAATGEPALTLTGHTRVVRAVAFSADGRRVATASWDGTVRVWDSDTGRAALTLTGAAQLLNAVSFSPDGGRLAAGATDGTLCLWETGTGQQTFLLKGHTGGVNAVAFSRDGRRLVTGSDDGAARLWDAQGGEWALPPVQLNDLAWKVVRQQGLDAEAYQEALRQAEEACRVEPDNGLYLNTLGVAQYRVGQYREALDTLTRSGRLNWVRFLGAHPADVAFTALTQHRLGLGEQARETRARLRALVKERRWSADEEAKAFLREVEAELAASKP